MSNKGNGRELPLLPFGGRDEVEDLTGKDNTSPSTQPQQNEIRVDQGKIEQLLLQSNIDQKAQFEKRIEELKQIRIEQKLSFEAQLAEQKESYEQIRIEQKLSFEAQLADQKESYEKKLTDQKESNEQKLVDLKEETRKQLAVKDDEVEKHYRVRQQAIDDTIKIRSVDQELEADRQKFYQDSATASVGSEKARAEALAAQLKEREERERKDREERDERERKEREVREERETKDREMREERETKDREIERENQRNTDREREQMLFGLMANLMKVPLPQVPEQKSGSVHNVSRREYDQVDASGTGHNLQQIENKSN